MMIKALRYEILRAVPVGSVRPLNEKPVRVATLIAEDRFLQSEGLLEHNKSVFLEDQHHDWSWVDGQFRYYSRVCQEGDVVAVYEQETVGAAPAPRRVRAR